MRGSLPLGMPRIRGALVPLPGHQAPRICSSASPYDPHIQVAGLDGGWILLINLLCFLAMPCSMWDLSSPTRD